MLTNHKPVLPEFCQQTISLYHWNDVDGSQACHTEMRWLITSLSHRDEMTDHKPVTLRWDDGSQACHTEMRWRITSLSHWDEMTDHKPVTLRWWITSLSLRWDDGSQACALEMHGEGLAQCRSTEHHGVCEEARCSGTKLNGILQEPFLPATGKKMIMRKSWFRVSVEP